MKRVAIVMRKAPYGSVYSAEGIRAIMGLGVFEMDVQVLFLDDGVYAMVKGQDPEALDMKPLGAAFAMLPEFDVTDFYVHEPSLQERGLTTEDLVMDVKLVDDGALADILASCDAVMPF